MGENQLTPAQSTGGARYLFLQGPNGPFFCELAKRLQAGGASIFRIHINGGDPVFWRLRNSVAESYRGTARDWLDFANSRFTAWGITDLVVFGDCRPLHRAAIRLAHLRSIRVHVFEEGYLRPHWVTLEADGVNRFSSLPREPDDYRTAARDLDDEPPARPVPYRFWRRAAEDVLYTLNLALRAFFYPHYRTHRPWHPLVEYAAGAKRFFFKRRMQRESQTVVERLLKGETPYFLFPLQLDADAQIRFHSPYGDMGKAIREVLASFARHAPPQSRLVLTEHPLDNGVIDLKAATLAMAHTEGIAARVDYLQGGSPDALLRRARAVVTVNSTLGIIALGLGLPVAVLGDAIYKLPGLVHLGPLDDFWRAPTAADHTLFEAFRRVVLARTQLNGSFYSPEGRRMAVEAAALRLEALPQGIVEAGDAPQLAPGAPLAISVASAEPSAHLGG